MIQDIANELNRRSKDYRIGLLQDIRCQIKGTTRRSSRKIFSALSIKNDYAFHHGGRTELQFNVGFETIGPIHRFRHGVAFSLEPGINLPDVSILFPQIRRFNEFFDLYPNEFPDMRLWFWQKGTLSPDLYPGSISEEVARSGTFVCLGKHYAPEELDFDLILHDFDRLLPLYEFVVGSSDFPDVSASGPDLFVAGHRPRAAATRALKNVGVVDVALRHNVLQEQLHRELSNEFGFGTVRTEYVTALKTRIDTVVQRTSGKIYYEIKTGSSARSCIRQALSQLLEYAFWPGAEEPARLVIVGEPNLDEDAARYLGALNDRFGLAVEYRTIILKI